MNVIIAIIKALLLQGAVPLLIIGLAAGVALLYGGARAARLGRRGLALLGTIYWLLSMPLGSRLHEAPLTFHARAIGAAFYDAAPR